MSYEIQSRCLIMGEPFVQGNKFGQVEVMSSYRLFLEVAIVIKL